MDSHDVGADKVPLGSRRDQEATHTTQTLHVGFTGLLGHFCITLKGLQNL